MGKSLLLGTVLAAMLVLAIGLFFVLEQQQTEAAVIGLPDMLSGVECPGEELVLGWGESGRFTLDEAEHGVEVLSIYRPQHSPSEVTLRVDNKIKEPLAVGRRVPLRGGFIQFLSLTEGKANLCVIPSE